MYKLKNCNWNSVFAVPSDIIEKFLKNSSEVQLKVLILIFKNSIDIDTQKISKCLGISLSEAQNELNYWTNKNILECDDINQGINYDLCDKKTKKAFLRYQKPDSLYISKRIDNSSDFKSLISESEIILGRPLSFNDISILLMLHDNEGLPIDVILMLVQFSVNNGKINMRYIEKVGISWAEQGIITHKDAENKIRKMDEAKSVWNSFENIVGISHRAPSNKEQETIWRWFCVWKFNESLIKEAYERCVDKNGKYVLKYMDSIVTRWKNQGVNTIEQALAEKTIRKKATKQSSSYNIDEYESYNIFEEMQWDQINSMIKGNKEIR